MTLAATRAKLEEATRRESAALGLTSSAKRLPPARIIGQGRPDTGAVVGVTDPARTGPWNPDAVLLGTSGRWPQLGETIARVQQLLSATKA